MCDNFQCIRLAKNGIVIAIAFDITLFVRSGSVCTLYQSAVQLYIGQIFNAEIRVDPGLLISGKCQYAVIKGILLAGIALQVESCHLSGFVCFRQKCYCFLLIVRIFTSQNDIVKFAELIDQILINAQFCGVETGFCFSLLFIRNLSNDLGIIQNRDCLIGKLCAQHKVTVIRHAENGFISVRVARCRTCGFFLIVIVNMGVDTESRAVYMECHRCGFCLLFHQRMLRCHRHFRSQVIEPVTCAINAQFRCVALCRREVALQIGIADLNIGKVQSLRFPIGQVDHQIAVCILGCFQFCQGKGFHRCRPGNILRQKCGQLDAFDLAALRIVGREGHLIRQIALYNFGAVFFGLNANAFQIHGNHRLSSLGITAIGILVFQQEAIVQTLRLIGHGQACFAALVGLRSIGSGRDRQVGICHFHSCIRTGTRLSIDAADHFKIGIRFQRASPVCRTVQFQRQFLQVVQIQVAVYPRENDAHTAQTANAFRHFVCHNTVFICRQGIRRNRQIRFNFRKRICGICCIVPVKQLDLFDLGCLAAANTLQNDFPGVEALQILEAVVRLISHTVHIHLEQRIGTGRTGIIGQQELIPCLLCLAAVWHSQRRIDDACAVFICDRVLCLYGFCSIFSDSMHTCSQLRQYLRHLQGHGSFRHGILSGLVVVAKAVCCFQFSVRLDRLFRGRRTIDLNVTVVIACTVCISDLLFDAPESQRNTQQIGQRVVPRRLRDHQIAVCIFRVLRKIQRHLFIHQIFSGIAFSAQHNRLDVCIFQQRLAEDNAGSHQAASAVVVIGIQPGNVHRCWHDTGNTVIGNHKPRTSSVIIQRYHLGVSLLHQFANGIIVYTDTFQHRVGLFCPNHRIGIVYAQRILDPSCRT